MTKWRYWVVHSGLPMTGELNGIGEEGWELVEIIKHGVNDYTFVFKRPVG